MAFSKEWERTFSAQRQVSKWPWSDVVSMVMRHTTLAAQPGRVLELGCGTGPNIPFFASLVGARNYHAMEGSQAAVDMILAQYPELAGNVVVGDFTSGIPFEGAFDLIFDRGSLTHNDTAGIKRCLAMARPLLAPGGVYLGVDWFSTACTVFGQGEPGADPNTRRYAEGWLAGLGNAHFSTPEHLEDLFAGFSIISLTHKILETHLPEKGDVKAFYSFAAAAR